MRKKLLVTGANGQLGCALRDILALREDIDATFTDREELDLTDVAAVKDFVASMRPDYIVNCAAYTAVDLAEENPDTAALLNASVPRTLAEVAREEGAKLVHISTDYVFAGTDPSPRTETDPTEPQNVYGHTKLAGEQAVREAYGEGSVILRTAWLYSPYGNNFVKTMLRLACERTHIDVVADQWGTPTSAHSLAAAVMAVIDFADWKPGTYHFTDSGEATWYALASEVVAMAGLKDKCEVRPILTSQFPTKANRPAYSLLSKDKFCKTFDYPLRPWREALHDTIELTCLKTK